MPKLPKTAVRPIQIQANFTKVRGGSLRIAAGDTQVLCTAMIEEGVPEFREPTGGGWLTAEYRMLPSSTLQRKAREADGRCTEIQRLIGRCLRAVIDLNKIGQRTIFVDCDVLHADGGTRAASVTGAYVAIHLAIQKAMQEGLFTDNPIKGMVAAVSVGIVDGRPVLDLNYEQDSRAQVDFNVAMTCRGEFVEIQGTAEGRTFSRGQLNELLILAESGIRQIMECQKAALKSA